MSAYMSTSPIDGNITVYCGRCFSHVPGAIFGTWENNYSNIAIAQRARDEHNEAKHPVFKPAVLANLGSLGNGYHVSAEDFTESHNGAGEGTTPEQAIEAWSERVKELRSKADARDLDAAKQEIKTLKTALKQRMKNDWETHLELEILKRKLGLADEQVTKTTSMLGDAIAENEELKTAIQELLETPEPMPLCKNPEGHNYLPLDQMFVFCTRCGHSIHYKTKG